MKSLVAPEVLSILFLIKTDANELLKRLVVRKDEYLMLFSLKRNRAHFEQIFYSKYPSTPLSELKLIQVDTLVAVTSFYTKVEELKWYLYHTEDLPGSVEIQVNKVLQDLKSLNATLNLYIDGQLGYQEVKTA